MYLYSCVLSCSLMANSLQTMDCNLPDFSIRGIFQARNTGVGCHALLPNPGDLPNPGMEPMSLLSPALAGGFFTITATWEALKSIYTELNILQEKLIRHNAYLDIFWKNL